MKLLICVGPSASGKSTFCETLLASKEQNWIRVSRDEYRYMWTNTGFCSNKIESLITKRTYADIGFFLSNKYNVVYDATNLTSRVLNDLIEKFGEIADIDFVVFEVDIDECIKRDGLRKRTVGESVIREQFRKFEILKKEFDFSGVGRRKKKAQVFEFDTNKKNAIVVDIDGTLAHMINRNPFDEAKVIEDVVDENVRFIINTLRQGDKNLAIIFCSGRTDSCREDTKLWFEYYSIPYDNLFMRKTGDSRKDSIIKWEIYQEHILPFYNVVAVFDDRDQVVDILRDKGIKVFQVAEGNF